MPMSRSRGGTKMPRAGDDTRCPAMLISPEVGCSRPATQRKVVVLPQPDGPSRTTISPAGTTKLTPSIAGRPIENCLRRSVTSSVAVMVSLSSSSSSVRRSLPVAENLVPLGNPGAVQLHIVVELRKPDFYGLRIETLRVELFLERGEVAQLPDHEALPLLGKTPIEEQFRGIGMGCGLRNSRGVGIDWRAFGREEDIDRRAVLLFRVDRIVEQGTHRDFPAHHRVRHRRTRWIEDRMGRSLLRPVILPQHLSLEHDAGPGGAAGLREHLPGHFVVLRLG